FSLLVSSAFGQSVNANANPFERALTVMHTEPVPRYKPATSQDKLRWFVSCTLSRSRLFIVGPFSAGWGTLRNVPSEYGTHWVGFGKRNGMRLTGVATGNLIEASLGSVWGEDPTHPTSGTLAITFCRTPGVRIAKPTRAMPSSVAYGGRARTNDQR